MRESRCSALGSRFQQGLLSLTTGAAVRKGRTAYFGNAYASVSGEALLAIGDVQLYIGGTTGAERPSAAGNPSDGRHRAPRFCARAWTVCMRVVAGRLHVLGNSLGGAEMDADGAVVGSRRLGHSQL